jgi:hypothetical protein
MWPAEMVKLVKEHFVAVSTTLHGHPEDEEGKFYNSLQCAWGTGRFHAVTAGGKPLCAPEGDNFCCNVPVAWARWNALPESERKPGAVQVPHLKSYDSAFARRPAGSIILKSYNRILEFDPKGDWRRKTGKVHRLNLNQDPKDPRWIQDPEPGRTWVWLDEAQWRSLVPAHPKAGDAVAVPDGVAHRLLRLTMLDTIYCFSWAWGAGALRSQELKLMVVDAGSRSLSMRLEGTVLFEEPKRTYDARITGVLEYDPKEKVFKKIEITAVGDWTWPNRDGKPGQVLGVSIELWPHRFASPAYDRFFPGFSMQHYGYDQSKE